MILLLKSYNKGYVRKDGVVVNPFTDKRVKASSQLINHRKSSGPKGVPHPGPMPQSSTAADYASAVLGGKQPLKPVPASKWAGKGEQKLVAPQYGIGQKQKSLFGGESNMGDVPPWAKQASAPKPKPKPAAWHPKADDDGKRVPIYKQQQAGHEAHWHLPNEIGVFLPGGAVPPSINGLAIDKWVPPKDKEGWANIPGQMPHLNEPELNLNGPANEDGKSRKYEPAAGVVIEEPDGRVWVVCPTNQHAGYSATYPKGHADEGLSLQATAIKEAFEESGLKVEITGLVGDFAGGLTMTRYYRAKRVSGTPSDMGWESQAVKLVPKGDLKKILNASRDHKIAEAIA